ncbi:hypothetical protein BKD02_07110 [Brucella sp. 09RB8910]|nr:hypothetical protein BKD02_07110 [Brucella sp. 09RB8910]
MLICKASSAQGCSPSTTLNQNFMQKGILECRQGLGCSYFIVGMTNSAPSLTPAARPQQSEDAQT